MASVDPRLDAVENDDASLRGAIRQANITIPPDTRFAATIIEMAMGQPEFAALPLDRFMRVPTYAPIPNLDDGVNAIMREVQDHGDEVMKECLNYVMREAAGSSPKVFPNSPYARDCDANGVRDDRRTAEGEQMRFSDFVAHAHARRSDLYAAHVLALRLYTTAAFVNLNTPMRQLSPEGDRCAEPHPFPNTVRFIRDAIKQLRTNNAPAPGERDATQFLYRGIKDMHLSADFLQRGGSELATMSTTPTLEVAMRYAASASPILLRLRTRNFIERGADISFCSAFPAENEVVYPPMTFLQPKGEARKIEGVTVVDVEVAVS